MRTAAYYLFLVFVASWFLHLSERLPALGAIRFDLLNLALIILLLVISKDEKPQAAAAEANNADSSRTQRLIFTIVAYAIITIPVVEWPGSVLNKGLPDYIKAIVFYFFTAKLITTPQRLRALMLVFVPAMTIRVLEPVYLHVTTGYWGSFASIGGGEVMERLAGAPYDSINGNGLAFVILTVLPFLHFLAPMTVLGGLAYVATLPLLIWALLLTGSRSGLLGFFAILLAVWFKSRRKILLLLVVGVAAVLVAPLLSDDLVDRYRSIFDSNTRNAATAQGRMSGVEKDLGLAMRRPIFGHGLGTSREVMANFGGEDQPSHNLYTETAQELGIIGVVLLVATIVSIVANLRVSLRELRAAAAPGSLFIRLTDAVQVWLAMNILFSFASFGLSSYEWYFAAGLSDVLRRFANELQTSSMVEQSDVAPTAVATPFTRPLVPAETAAVSARLRGA